MNVLLYEQPFGNSLSAVHAYELWAEMRKLGVEATFVTEDPKLPGAVARVAPRLAGPPPRLRWTRPRSASPYVKYRLQRLQPLRSLLTLYQVCQQEQALSRLASRYPVPDVVYRRHNYLNTEVAYGHSHGRPVVTEVNGIIQEEAQLNWWASSLSNKIVTHWENSHFGQADHYIVVSHYLKDVLADRFHVPGDRISVVLNGVNTDRFRPTDMAAARKELGLNPSTPYIIFCGSLQVRQGVEYLIRSMAFVRERIPEAVLLIVGSGADHMRLQRVEAPPGSVVFMGQVAYVDVPAYVAAANVCAMPYVPSYNDQIGITPLKLGTYLACGRPVVASDIRGLECLHYENCGTIVKPREPEALAAALCDLLQNPWQAQRMGANGRRFILAERTWKQAARQTLGILENVVKEYK